MSNPDVIAEKLAWYHKDGCEKRSPHLIMAPRPTWGPDAVPIWRPRVEGDRPHICTCGLDDALALLTAATPEKEQEKVPCGVRFRHPDGYIVGCEEPLHHAGDHGAFIGKRDEIRWPTAAPLPSAQEKAWQPIETAPLAKMVLLWARGWRQPFIGARNGDLGAVFLDGASGQGQQMYGATHWMPLPSPPLQTRQARSSSLQAQTEQAQGAREAFIAGWRAAVRADFVAASGDESDVADAPDVAWLDYRRSPALSPPSPDAQQEKK